MDKEEARGILRRWADPADAMQVAYEKGLKAGQDALTAAESRGRDAGLREAAGVLRGYAMNEDNMCDHVHDGHQHAKFLGLRAAAAILSRLSPANKDMREWEWVASICVAARPDWPLLTPAMKAEVYKRVVTAIHATK